MKWYLILLLVFSCVFTFAQERILSYDVNITLTLEDRIIVEEIIKVVAEGNQIKRGIYRTIPTYRNNELGNREFTPIEIKSVQRDGVEEKFNLQRNNNEITVYIGDENEQLPPATYTYNLVYEAENQIGFFDNYDELYWNYIGHHWPFMIESYSATLNLPEGAAYVQGACYTGFYGSNAQNCTVDTSMTFSTKVIGNGQLLPGEGATLAIAWTKGIVVDHYTQKVNNYTLNIVVFIIGLSLILIIMYVWWNRVGLDPPSLPVVPDWNPPAGYSPADLNYIKNRSISTTTESAALISAAIKGALRIDVDEKQNFTFRKTNNDVVLEKEESAFVNKLFESGTEFVLTKNTHMAYRSASTAFRNSLNFKIRIKDYIIYNTEYLFYGVALISLLLTLTLCIGRPTISNVSLWFAIPIIFFVTLVEQFFLVLIFQIENFFRYIVLLFVFPISVLFLWMLFTNLFLFSNNVLCLIFIVVSLLLGMIFGYLIRAPTVKGQETISKIKGFRQYLVLTEKKLLEYFTPPRQTPKHFEKMLPYAIALGVENKWARKFKKILDMAIESGTYYPTWYSGDFKAIYNVGRHLQSSVTKSAPSSSGSGSGGGGFSGGGGGGGGGGGW